MKKHKKLYGRKTKAARLLRALSLQRPELFEHWKRGIPGTFA